ncbi:hypothetical protein BDV93DRAFT_67352 [Ceratobasidium sp. AG-I]|nr:hypothetical protein BDV93DRAFT_67352 [Ceratobasidium sp. AG-I]
MRCEMAQSMSYSVGCYMLSLRAKLISVTKVSSHSISDINLLNLIPYLEHIRLATAPAKVDFQAREHAQFYRLMLQFCNDHNPFDGVVFYGAGRRPPGGIYLRPTGSTHSYSHFFRHGVRYGSANHYRGKKSRFGFIQNRVPVIIRGIYKTTFEINGEEHNFSAAMVQCFVMPERQPVFPWDEWAEFLGINAWAFEQFQPIEAVPLNIFTGVFALSDIEMTYGHYWLTFEMINTNPEDRVEDYD